MVDQPNPFQSIQLSDPDINRIQANIAKAFNSFSAGGDLVYVTEPVSNVASSGCLLLIDTHNIGGNSPQIFLPDAVSNINYRFSYKKLDTSSNIITFMIRPGAKNKQGAPQTVDLSSSISVSGSLAFGSFFSDGSNWWTN